MKKVIVVFATFMAIASISEAKNPKSTDAKTTDATASPTEAKAQTGATYYWFQTDANGTLTSRIAESNSMTALDPSGCNGSGDPCGLGFDASDTQISGSGQRELKPSVTEENAEVVSLQN